MSEKNLVYRVIEYGLQKKVFSFRELNADLKLNGHEYNLVFERLIHFQGEINSNHLLTVVQAAYDATLMPNDFQNSKLSLLPTAVFQYNDYLEIIEARKSAQEARRLSWYAIWISIGLGVLQIIFR